MKMEGFPLHPGVSGPVFSKEDTEHTEEKRGAMNFAGASSNPLTFNAPFQKLCAGFASITKSAESTAQ
jgi:hypothetical protein